MNKFSHNLLFIFLASIALLTSCGKAKKTEIFVNEGDSTKVKSVEVATVIRKTINDRQEYSTTIQAKVTNEIAPQMASRIRKIYVEVGQSVARGQLLAEMDNSQLEQSRLQVEQQRATFARLDELHKIGGVSQADWESSKRSLEIAQTSFRNLQENTQLRSPISGVVTARNYDAGDMMSMQAPLFVVEQINPVVLRINPSEQYFGLISKGMPVTIESDAVAGETFTGKVALKYPTIDPKTHTFTLEVEAPNAHRKLVPGLYARVIVDLGSRESIVVPNEAVVKQVGSGEQYVFVVRNGVAHRQVVTVDGVYGSDTAIKEGVNAGDVVVTTGAAVLVDKTRVSTAKK